MGVGAGLLLLIALAVVASFFIDEPLRRTIERRMNERLDGYTVTLGKLDFHPLGFSIDFGDIVVSQNAHPDPPVAKIEELQASVQWRQLLRAKLVANFAVKRPAIYLDTTHFVQEAKDDVPLEKRGWQDALQEMYPLKINEFKIEDGSVTYVDDGPFAPLKLTGVNARAGNIRNIASKAGEYPSDVFVEATVFDSGKVKLEGNADFLAEPNPAVKAAVVFDNITLDYFQPITRRYHLTVRKGVLTGRGDFEFAPAIRAVNLAELTLSNANIDYVFTPQPAAPEKKVATQAVKTAVAVSNDPGVRFTVGVLRISDGTFGLVHSGTKPSYRMFIGNTNLELRNLSNHSEDGEATLLLTGKFMGSGDTKVTGAFRSETKGPNFTLNVAIQDTQMRTMNDVLRAYGKFDVVDGHFSFFSEFKAKDGRIEGYVKPLFRGMDVYDKEQDRDKGVFRKLWERVVGGVSSMLENRPRSEVATRTEVSGPLENPSAKTWEVIVRLVQNAFFEAIMPGFDRGVRSPRRG